ncbi:hypothetical protein M9Y10_003103 [Tritrichomonas musculus]|uniref:Uncharacterized protein n=1 Tax=Tritrichomonas musculus TaxID=1915356 RepID=A0ABR2JNP5_9EUKA
MSEEQTIFDLNDESNGQDLDDVVIQLSSEVIVINYYQLIKWSKLVREHYQKDQIDDLSKVIQHYQQIYNIKTENIVSFFQYLSDEQVEITLDQYCDHQKLSTLFGVPQFQQALKKYSQKHRGDVDFIIKLFKENLSNQYMRDLMGEMSCDMESILINNIDQCFKNPEFGDLPITKIYRIIEQIPKNIPSELLCNFIKESLDDRYILLTFVKMHEISDENFFDLCDKLLNSENSKQKIYVQYLGIDIAYLSSLRAENILQKQKIEESNLEKKQLIEEKAKLELELTTQKNKFEMISKEYKKLDHEINDNNNNQKEDDVNDGQKVDNKIVDNVNDIKKTDESNTGDELFKNSSLILKEIQKLKKENKILRAKNEHLKKEKLILLATNDKFLQQKIDLMKENEQLKVKKQLSKKSIITPMRKTNSKKEIIKPPQQRESTHDDKKQPQQEKQQESSDIKQKEEPLKVEQKEEPLKVEQKEEPLKVEQPTNNDQKPQQKMTKQQKSKNKKHKTSSKVFINIDDDEDQFDDIYGDEIYNQFDDVDEFYGEGFEEEEEEEEIIDSLDDEKDRYPSKPLVPSQRTFYDDSEDIKKLPKYLRSTHKVQISPRTKKSPMQDENHLSRAIEFLQKIQSDMMPLATNQESKQAKKKEQYKPKKSLNYTMRTESPYGYGENEDRRDLYKYLLSSNIEEVKEEEEEIKEKEDKEIKKDKEKTIVDQNKEDKMLIKKQKKVNRAPPQTISTEKPPNKQSQVKSGEVANTQQLNNNPVKTNEKQSHMDHSTQIKALSKSPQSNKTDIKEEQKPNPNESSKQKNAKQDNSSINPPQVATMEMLSQHEYQPNLFKYLLLGDENEEEVSSISKNNKDVPDSTNLDDNQKPNQAQPPFNNNSNKQNEIIAPKDQNSSNQKPTVSNETVTPSSMSNLSSDSEDQQHEDSKRLTRKSAIKDPWVNFIDDQSNDGNDQYNKSKKHSKKPI